MADQDQVQDQAQDQNQTNGPVQIVIPPKPRPTRELEQEADDAIAFIEKMTTSTTLLPEIRIILTDVKNTIKNLKSNVVRMSEEAQVNHERLVEIVRFQRLIG